MDAVRELILKRLGEVGLTMSEASHLINRNASYLQQFLKRGIPTELHERDRGKLAQLLNLSEDELRGSSTPLPPRGYAKIGNNHSRRRESRESVTFDPQNFIENRRDFRIIRGQELPVYGTAQVPGGAFTVTAKPIDWEARPDFLARREDAYGLIVSGDSMDPECKNGSTVLVDPHLPPKNGDTCVFRSKKDNVDMTATVKVLVRSNEQSWFVRQHNPPKKFELRRFGMAGRPYCCRQLQPSLIPSHCRSDS
jgi:phage repressor protein C with HTH and peptisase S24 domain